VIAVHSTFNGALQLTSSSCLIQDRRKTQTASNILAIFTAISTSPPRILNSITNSMASTMSGSAATSKTSSADTKILADLGTVKEKMDLCDALMNPGAGDPKPSLQSSEAMLAVVGFLEACAPRMVELVEAAASGALSEDIFAECLAVNDRLQKQLADIETAALTETSASTTAASAAPASVEQQFEDLLLGDDTAASGGAVGKSTGEEDAKQSAITTQDEFDDFLAERTG
jgi:hypothetical protein